MIKALFGWCGNHGPDRDLIRSAFVQKFTVPLTFLPSDILLVRIVYPRLPLWFRFSPRQGFPTWQTVLPLGWSAVELAGMHCQGKASSPSVRF